MLCARLVERGRGSLGHHRLIPTIQVWNGSSQPSSSSTSSARPSSSRRAIPRSSGAGSPRSSSTSRTASPPTAEPWRSSPATPSWPPSGSRRHTRTTPSAPSAPRRDHRLRPRPRARGPHRHRGGRGRRRRADSTFATGEAVNVAARLQQAAEPGEILIGPFAHRLTAGAVETEPVGPLELRGFGEPMPACRPLAVRDSDRPASPSVAAPFVGRECELDLLENTLARTIRDRRAQVFTVYGEPGVGKSRLAREFLAGVEGATDSRRPRAALRRRRHVLAAGRDGQGRRPGSRTTTR